MEEDITNNAEFPENGVFDLGPIPGSKYKACGDFIAFEQSEGIEKTICPRFAIRGPGASSGWGQPRPWASEGFQVSSDSLSEPGPSKKRPFMNCV